MNLLMVRIFGNSINYIWVYAQIVMPTIKIIFISCFEIFFYSIEIFQNQILDLFEKCMLHLINRKNHVSNRFFSKSGAFLMNNRATKIVFYLQSIFQLNDKNLIPKSLNKCCICYFVYIAYFNTIMLHSSKIIFNLFDCHKI